MFWAVFMIQSQVFQHWLSDVLEEFFINVFVHDAFDKMISHS
jgi:hypothetical protein